MRTLSSAALGALYAQQTGDVFLPLLSISGGGISDINLVQNYQSITSNGVIYVPCAFNVILPQDGEQLRPASVIIDNVDRSMTEAIASITDPLNITIAYIRADDPDVIEYSFEAVLRNVTINNKYVQGDIYYLEHLTQGFPKIVKTPRLFPGIF